MMNADNVHVWQISAYAYEISTYLPKKINTYLPSHFDKFFWI